MLLLVGCGIWGCAPQRSLDSASSHQRDRYEISCETGLQRLQQLIDMRSSQTDFPRGALIEAQELFKMGRELYLEREYTLALDMINEGIQLVEEESD